MTAGSSEPPAARRMRRLRELGRNNQITLVNNAVRAVWEQPGGPRPNQVRLRPQFLMAGDGSAPSAPMARLITSRGVPLRFYLLAIFEAQCRPPSAEPWKNVRPVSGRLGWEDLIAVDAAYSRHGRAYQIPATKQKRTLSSSRVRQVKGALTKLEEREDQALVEIPRKANGKHRDYDGFALMKESGRGDVPTPDYYTPPGPAAIGIPVQFFLSGWVQLLYPSEIATWLTFRLLRWAYLGRHNESGVYLYGQDRENTFGLLRDSYEDGCRSLADFGADPPGAAHGPRHPSGDAERGPGPPVLPDRRGDAQHRRGRAGPLQAQPVPVDRRGPAQGRLPHRHDQPAAVRPGVPGASRQGLRDNYGYPAISLTMA